jgi:hypothetical protein
VLKIFIDYIKVYFDYLVFPTAPASCTTTNAIGFSSATPTCTVDTATTTAGFYIKLAGASVS